MTTTSCSRVFRFVKIISVVLVGDAGVGKTHMMNRFFIKDKLDMSVDNYLKIAFQLLE